MYHPTVEAGSDNSVKCHCIVYHSPTTGNTSLSLNARYLHGVRAIVWSWPDGLIEHNERIIRIERKSCINYKWFIRVQLPSAQLKNSCFSAKGFLPGGFSLNNNAVAGAYNLSSYYESWHQSTKTFLSRMTCKMHCPAFYTVVSSPYYRAESKTELQKTQWFGISKPPYLAGRIGVDCTCFYAFEEVSLSLPEK